MCNLNFGFDPPCLESVANNLKCTLLQELRRHIELFNESGKMSIAYMERAGEKEYYLATAFKARMAGH